MFEAEGATSLQFTRYSDGRLGLLPEGSEPLGRSETLAISSIFVAEGAKSRVWRRVAGRVRAEGGGRWEGGGGGMMKMSGGDDGDDGDE